MRNGSQKGFALSAFVPEDQRPQVREELLRAIKADKHPEWLQLVRNNPNSALLRECRDGQRIS
jgi:hypothetical protein